MEYLKRWQFWLAVIVVAVGVHFAMMLAGGWGKKGGM